MELNTFHENFSYFQLSWKFKSYIKTGNKIRVRISTKLSPEASKRKIIIAATINQNQTNIEKTGFSSPA